MKQTEKLYFSDPVRFADLFNAFLFEGTGKITPESLTECEAEDLFEGIDPEAFPMLDRERLIRREAELSGKKADLNLYLMMDENEADLSLPVSLLSLEVLSYQKQIRDWRKSTEDLMLAGTLTLALYLGRKEWNAPQKLSELFDPDGFLQPEGKGRNCRTCLVTPASLKRRQLNSLTTDVKEILFATANADNEKKLRRFAAQNRERLELLDPDAKELFQTVSGIEL